MDFDIIVNSLKKAWGDFTSNAVALIVGLLIAVIGSILIVTIAPLFYGLYSMILKATRGEKVEIKDVFCGFKSFSVFIRSWIYYLVYLVVAFVIGIITGILVSVSPALTIIGSLLTFIWGLVTLFAIYVYIMTPSENAIYAYKEGFNIFKENLLMTLVTYIVMYILVVIGAILLLVGLLVTVPIALLFVAYVLKAMKPELRDGSEA